MSFHLINFKTNFVTQSKINWGKIKTDFSVHSYSSALGGKSTIKTPLTKKKKKKKTNNEEEEWKLGNVNVFS